MLILGGVMIVAGHECYLGMSEFVGGADLIVENYKYWLPDMYTCNCCAKQGEGEAEKNCSSASNRWCGVVKKRVEEILNCGAALVCQRQRPNWFVQWLKRGKPKLWAQLQRN
ncbi:hypothetical protein C5167_010611 [Papaver somniferum]|uniref:Uncharacterized protein n=1 Tax=Papaver somniferum TaxID=3469 RepID=A0A4Y7K264_PAPSO|nr:hypothetical protein C5167_010611 [Papaver somniferum]